MSAPERACDRNRYITHLNVAPQRFDCLVMGCSERVNLRSGGGFRLRQSDEVQQVKDL